jgi:hypothetical protein
MQRAALLVVVILCWTAGCLQSGPAVTVYTDPEHHFRIEYPAAWGSVRESVSANDEYGIITFRNRSGCGSSETKAPLFATECGTIPLLIGVNTTYPRTAADLTTAFIRADPGNYTLEEKKIAGDPAYYLDKGSSSFVLVVHARHAYTFWFVRDAIDEPTMQAMIRSVAFI